MNCSTIGGKKDPQHISSFPTVPQTAKDGAGSQNGTSAGENGGAGIMYSELSMYNISNGKTIKWDWWRDEDNWVGWGGRSVCAEGGVSWIWLYVYPCLRTSWRHKCQLWAVCGLPTKLLARSDPDWFYLLDSWHATYEPWPSMCHSNAMASQPPLTSVLMDIRVSILYSRLSAVATAFSRLPILPMDGRKMIFLLRFWSHRMLLYVLFQG